MADTADGPVPDGRDRRRSLGQTVRDARERKGWSQQALGERVEVNRSSINRIEGDKQGPSPEVALKLAEVLEEPQILHLSQHGEKEVHPASLSRDAALDQYLSVSAVDRLVLVLADEVDIVGLLARHRLHLPPTVTVVFPTQERQERLRVDSDPGVIWNVQGQINKMFEALAAGGRLRPNANDPREADVNLYESDGVRQSFALVGTSEGTFCVAWPTLPNIGRAEDDFVPAAVTNDSAFLQRVEAHITTLLRERAPLTHLKVLVVVEGQAQAEDKQDERPSGAPVRHRFSTFFTLGEDTEESQVAAAEQDARFGIAVALVLVHGIVDRTGRTLGRRILLPLDSRSGTYELFSAHVSDEDLDDAGSGGRSTLTARAALGALRQRQPDFVVDPDAFRRAARRGLKDEFAIDVDVQYLHETPLPPRLWQVDKPGEPPNRRLAIVPRLYELDLTAAVAAAGVPGEGLERALLDATKGIAVGQADFRSPQQVDRLNDFLQQAVGDDAAPWFFDCLARLEIAMS